MNLESLRQKILSQTKTVEVGGATYRIGKMSAVDGLEVNAYLSGLEWVGEGESRTLKNKADIARFYIVVLSKSILNDSGAKDLDTDEGRGLLSQLPQDELLPLGEAACEWNGMQKKS